MKLSSAYSNICQKIIIVFLLNILLSGCFSLDHETTINQRYSSYTEQPKDCEGTIPIVVHWGSGWHTSIVIPNKDLIVSQYFKNFPYLEVNWGDKGFYQAGASELKQKLAAPKALLVPSESVMYFVGVAENSQGWCDVYDQNLTLTKTDKLLINNNIHKALNTCSEMNVDYGDMFQYFDARQIWVTPKDFSGIVNRINNAINVSENGNLIDLGNGHLFDSAYSTAGRFFQSSISYFGLFHTCNSWTAEVLGEIGEMNTIRETSIYRSEPIFEFIENEIKKGNSCVRKFE